MSEVAEAPERAGKSKLRRISHWIGGQIVLGESGRSGPVFNPAFGEQTAEVDFASAEEVGSAVAAAKEAFSSWRSVSLSNRQELMFRVRELLNERKEDIARILTDEH